MVGRPGCLGGCCEAPPARGRPGPACNPDTPGPATHPDRLQGSLTPQYVTCLLCPHLPQGACHPVWVSETLSAHNQNICQTFSSSQGGAQGKVQRGPLRPRQPFQKDPRPAGQAPGLAYPPGPGRKEQDCSAKQTQDPRPQSQRGILPPVGLSVHPPYLPWPQVANGPKRQMALGGMHCPAQ